MKYAYIDSIDIPIIKPPEPFLLMQDGSLYLQGFGLVCKFSSVECAIEYLENTSFSDLVKMRLESDNE